MSQAAVSDGELLARLRASDPSVLAIALDRYGGHIASVARRAWPGAAQEDLEELVADVLADLWFRHSELDPTRGTLGS